MLLGQLPPTSRCRRIIDPALEWTTTDYLLATVADVLNGANWQRSGGNGAKPKPIPRPGSQKRIGQARPAHEVRGLFDQWRTGHLHARPRKAVTHG